MLGNTLFLIGSTTVIIAIVSSIVFFAIQAALTSRLRKKLKQEYGSKPVR